MLHTSLTREPEALSTQKYRRDREVRMQNDNSSDYEIIFVRWFRHWRTGKIIRRPDGKPFPLRVRGDRRTYR